MEQTAKRARPIEKAPFDKWKWIAIGLTLCVVVGIGLPWWRQARADAATERLKRMVFHGERPQTKEDAELLRYYREHSEPNGFR